MDDGHEKSQCNRESEPPSFSNTNAQQLQEEASSHYSAHYRTSTITAPRNGDSASLSHASSNRTGSNSFSCTVAAEAAVSKQDTISRKRILPITRELPNRYKRAVPNESHVVATADPASTTTSMTQTKEEDDENDEPLTEEEHRDLVDAIFNIGLDHSSPRAISDNMSDKIKATYSALTLEKIKSKLQKYRKSKTKNTDEFMQIYDATLAQMLNAYPLKNKSVAAKISESSAATANFTSGEIAAYLTHTILSSKNRNDKTPVETTVQSSSCMDKQTEIYKGDVPPFQQPDWPLETPVHPESKKAISNNGRSLEFPTLTAQERASPLGQTFGYFLGLFNSLRADIYQNRAPTGIDIPSQTRETDTAVASKPLDTFRAPNENESNQMTSADNNLVPGEPLLPDQLLLQQSFAIADEGATILAGLAGGDSYSAGVHQSNVSQKGNTGDVCGGELGELLASNDTLQLDNYLPREGELK